MTSDLDLLGQFSRDKSQDAFTALVKRHVNLVYSAALRQVRSPQLAEEVAQSVFADLARVAATPSSPEILTPWLYAVTRRTAIDVIRKESRRQLREQIAVEMNAMNATANDWTQIEPLLDDAMAALDETDRSAILLRYFENKTLREVGEAIGTNDDAAQKRVSRAVERLREFFSKQKITIGASGLAVVISANAVQAAPIGLAATISAAAILAGTAVSTLTVFTATKAIAMTTFQKTLIAAALTAAVGTGIFEAHQAAQLRGQNQELQQQQIALTDQLNQLQQDRDDATNRLASSQAENARLESNPNQLELLRLRGEVTRLKNAVAQDEIDPTESAAKALATKVSQIKRWLEQNPVEKIPELQFLTVRDWLRTAGYFDKFETDDEFRSALSSLREQAKNDFAWRTGDALASYVAANNGQLPNDISQLKPYFASQIDDAILQRYQLLHSGNLSDFPQAEPLLAEKTPVDDEYDTLFKIGAFGFTHQDVGGHSGNGSGGFGTNVTAKIMPFAKR